MEPWDEVEFPGRAVTGDDDISYFEYPVKIGKVAPFPRVEELGRFGGELGEGYEDEDDE